MGLLESLGLVLVMEFSMVYDWVTIFFIGVLVIPSIIRGYFLYKKYEVMDGSFFEELLLSLMVTVFTVILVVYVSLTLSTMVKGVFNF